LTGTENETVCPVKYFHASAATVCGGPHFDKNIKMEKK